MTAAMICVADGVAVRGVVSPEGVDGAEAAAHVVAAGVLAGAPQPA